MADWMVVPSLSQKKANKVDESVARLIKKNREMQTHTV